MALESRKAVLIRSEVWCRSRHLVCLQMCLQQHESGSCGEGVIIVYSFCTKLDGDVLIEVEDRKNHVSVY